MKSKEVRPAINNGEKSPSGIFRVLDLASDARCTLFAYGKYYNGGKEVHLKAIQDDRFRGDLDKECQKQVHFKPKRMPLPECLKEEPSGYYDHVHFHMFDNIHDSVYEKEAIKVINDIHRILKNDGLFFFSADITFFPKSWYSGNLPRDWVNKYVQNNMNFLHNEISKKFDFLHFLHLEFCTDNIIAKFQSPEYGEVVSLFKASNDGVYRSYVQECRHFLALFSNEQSDSNYLAIAKKQ